MSCIYVVNLLESTNTYWAHPVCQAFCQAQGKECCSHGPFCPSRKRHHARNNDKVFNGVKNESMMFPEIGCLKVQQSGRSHGRIKIKIPN